MRKLSAKLFLFDKDMDLATLRTKNQKELVFLENEKVRRELAEKNEALSLAL